MLFLKVISGQTGMTVTTQLPDNLTKCTNQRTLDKVSLGSNTKVRLLY